MTSSICFASDSEKFQTVCKAIGPLVTDAVAKHLMGFEITFVHSSSKESSGGLSLFGSHGKMYLCDGVSFCIPAGEGFETHESKGGTCGIPFFALEQSLPVSDSWLASGHDKMKQAVEEVCRLAARDTSEKLLEACLALYEKHYAKVVVQTERGIEFFYERDPKMIRHLFISRGDFAVFTPVIDFSMPAPVAREKPDFNNILPEINSTAVVDCIMELFEQESNREMQQ